eukprot:COSAG06_NODE_7322_length_2546_cov_2.143032_3_plen_481_part_01
MTADPVDGKAELRWANGSVNESLPFSELGRPLAHELLSQILAAEPDWQAVAEQAAKHACEEADAKGDTALHHMLRAVPEGVHTQMLNEAKAGRAPRQSLQELLEWLLMSEEVPEDHTRRQVEKALHVLRERKVTTVADLAWMEQDRLREAIAEMKLEPEAEAELHAVVSGLPLTMTPGLSAVEINYNQFLGQLGLAHKEDDLADFLSPSNELAEIRQMDEDDLEDDILGEDDLGFTQKQKVAFRAAVRALPYGLPDAFDIFLAPLSLTEKKKDLAKCFSEAGNELTELVQMDEDDLEANILDNVGLDLSTETKVAFREAVRKSNDAIATKARLQVPGRQFIKALDTVAKQYPQAVDENARASAKTCGNPAVRRWAEVFGTFRPRKDRDVWYRVVGIKVHASKTCLVIFAEEVKTNRKVCLKLMSHEDQWQREIDMRTGDDGTTLSSEHVVPLLDHFVLDEGGMAFVKTDERLHGEAKWTHL